MVATPAPRTVRGARVEYRVRFHAAPPPQGGIRNLDGLLDRFPALRRGLDAMNERLGSFLGRYLIVVVGSFFAIVFVAALVWSLVIAPGKGRRIMSSLKEDGYSDVDGRSPSLERALQALAPFSLEGPAHHDLQESPPVVRQALARPAGGGTRYVINAVQSHQSVSYRSRWTPLERSFLLEARPLPLDLELYIRPRRSEVLRLSGSGTREGRFGLKEMALDGADPSFAQLYSVFTPEGRRAPLPSALQRAYLDLESELVLSKGIRKAMRQKEALLWANSKFCAEGWGLAASNVWLSPEAFAALIRAADRIAQAVDTDWSA
jgi:hypothetical protein